MSIFSVSLLILSLCRYTFIQNANYFNSMHISNKLSILCAFFTAPLAAFRARAYLPFCQNTKKVQVRGMSHASISVLSSWLLWFRGKIERRLYTSMKVRRSVSEICVGWRIITCSDKGAHWWSLLLRLYHSLLARKHQKAAERNSARQQLLVFHFFIQIM